MSVPFENVAGVHNQIGSLNEFRNIMDQIKGCETKRDELEKEIRNLEIKKQNFNVADKLCDELCALEKEYRLYRDSLLYKCLCFLPVVKNRCKAMESECKVRQNEFNRMLGELSIASKEEYLKEHRDFNSDIDSLREKLGKIEEEERGLEGKLDGLRVFNELLSGLSSKEISDVKNLSVEEFLALKELGKFDYTSLSALYRKCLSDLDELKCRQGKVLDELSEIEYVLKVISKLKKSLSAPDKSSVKDKNMLIQLRRFMSKNNIKKVSEVHEKQLELYREARDISQKEDDISTERDKIRGLMEALGKKNNVERCGYSKYVRGVSM